MTTVAAPMAASAAPSASGTDTLALSTHALNKSFGSLVVARDISIALPQGARYALIGPNGAGKTTLINLITGMLRPHSGRIQLGAEDITGSQHANVFDVVARRESCQRGKCRGFVTDVFDCSGWVYLRFERGRCFGSRSGAGFGILDHDEGEAWNMRQRSETFLEELKVELASRVVLGGPGAVVREPIGAHPVALDQLVDAAAAQDSPGLAREMRQQPRIGLHTVPLPRKGLAQCAGAGDATGGHWM